MMLFRWKRMSLVFGPDNDRLDGTRGGISANIQRESAPTFRKFGTKLVKSFVPKVHTMFNLYQNMNKKGDEGEGARRGSDVTGHDRFCQEKPRSRRKRRTFSRRTQSAIELDTEAMTTARAILRRGRSASIEDEESEDDKGSQLTNKIDSLAKILFNRVSVAKACRENETRYFFHLAPLSKSYFIIKIGKNYIFFSIFEFYFYFDILLRISRHFPYQIFKFRHKLEMIFLQIYRKL